MAISQRAQNWIRAAQDNKAEFLASGANLYPIVPINDQAAQEVRSALSGAGFASRDFDGNVCAARDVNGPDTIFQPAPQLPLVDTLGKVLAYGASQGWWKTQ